MPFLRKLSISNLRNISNSTIEPVSRFNVIYGENGSGKSTILESIYLLGLARSFRSSQIRPLIQHGTPECAVFAQLSTGASLGISKTQRGSHEVKISGKKAANTAELAHTLPVQLLNSDTFSILEGSPRLRRKFIDWGVFHVEHNFLPLWRNAQKVLSQRNNLLRRPGVKESELEPWSKEFVRLAEGIDVYRKIYVEKLKAAVDDISSELLPLEGLGLAYTRGWDENAGLEAVLGDNIKRDIRYGHTVYGPQRAELKVLIGNNNAIDVLSRGQQKILVAALKLAQGKVLQSEKHIECIYLIDDLPSELDRRNQLSIISLLDKLKAQVFITCIEPHLLQESLENIEEKELFHVKHGKIAAAQMT